METDAIGLPSVSPRPFTAARPTRRPVNDPGPEAAARPSNFSLGMPCRVSSAAMAGISCAEKVPPATGTLSMSSKLVASPRPRAILPCLPEVSTAKISIFRISTLSQKLGLKSGTRLQAGDLHTTPARRHLLKMDVRKHKDVRRPQPSPRQRSGGCLVP